MSQRPRKKRTISEPKMEENKKKKKVEEIKPSNKQLRLMSRAFFARSRS